MQFKLVVSTKPFLLRFLPAKSRSPFLFKIISSRQFNHQQSLVPGCDGQTDKCIWTVDGQTDKSQKELNSSVLCHPSGGNYYNNFVCNNIHQYSSIFLQQRRCHLFHMFDHNNHRFFYHTLLTPAFQLSHHE